MALGAHHGNVTPAEVNVKAALGIDTLEDV
jgi:hypothetical protein